MWFPYIFLITLLLAALVPPPYLQTLLVFPALTVALTVYIFFFNCGEICQIHAVNSVDNVTYTHPYVPFQDMILSKIFRLLSLLYPSFHIVSFRKPLRLLRVAWAQRCQACFPWI